jgi:SAM-dependent methyltransferase
VKVADVFRCEGLRGISTRLFRKRRQTQADAFDLSHGIDTCTQADLWRLNIPSPDWRDGKRYAPVSVEAFDIAMANLPITPSEYTFIDLGSGKGRVLILAFERGFRQVIGVEFSPELCTIAKYNLAATKATAQVVCQSATEFVFPTEPTVIFLYNSFGPTTLLSTLNHVRRGTYIIYVNPQHASVFDSLKFSLMYRTAGIVIWHDLGHA